MAFIVAQRQGPSISTGVTNTSGVGTTNHVPVFSDNTGLDLKNTPVTIDSSGNMGGIATLTATTIEALTTVTTGDTIISLQDQATAGSPPNTSSGLEVWRGASTKASLIWKESDARWEAGLQGSESKILLFSDRGNFTAAGTDGIAITGGTNLTIGSGSIAQQKADATHNGYLSQGDWSTFNSKQSTISFAPIGSSPNNAGGSISGGVITLQPADGSNPGLLTTAAQDIAGSKTFTATMVTQDIIPALDNAYQLGDATHAFTNLYFHGAIVGSSVATMTDGTTEIMDIGNRLLIDTSGNTTAVDWANRNLITSGGAIVLQWNQQYLYEPGAFLSLDWTNRALYDVNGNTAFTWYNPGVLDAHGLDLQNVTIHTFGGAIYMAGSIIYELYKVQFVGGSSYIAENSTGVLSFAPNGNELLRMDGNTINILFNTPYNSLDNNQTGQFVGGGYSNNTYVSYATLCGGSSNNIQSGGDYGFIGGGQGNGAYGGTHPVVCGGESNFAYNSHAAVVGGIDNECGGQFAFIGGGNTNQSLQDYGTVSGGLENNLTNFGAAFASFIGGGRNNECTNISYGVVCGGQGNYSYADWAAVVGGYQHNCGGQYCFIGGGYQNQAYSGQYIGVLGGRENVATGDFSSVVGGYNARCDHYNESGQGGGIFGTQGDCQISTMILSAKTTNATATEMFLDGADGTNSQRIILATDMFMTADIVVFGVDSTKAKLATFNRRVIISNAGGTTSLIGNLLTPTTDTGSGVAGVVPTGWAVSVTADNTNKSLKVSVTGAAATNIQWVAKVSVVQTRY